MNSLKKLMTVWGIAAICTLLALTASAQQFSGQDFKNMTAPQRAQYQTMLMKMKLNLSADQATRTEEINLRYAQKMEAVLKSDDGKMKRFKEAMSIQKAKDKELKKVFTADQYKQYEEVEKELESHFSGKLNMLN